MRLFTSVCLCVSACPVCALTFESLDLETSFLVHGYIVTISRSNSHIKLIRSRLRPQEQNVQATITIYTHLRMACLWLKGISCWSVFVTELSYQHQSTFSCIVLMSTVSDGTKCSFSFREDTHCWYLLINEMWSGRTMAEELDDLLVRDLALQNVLIVNAFLRRFDVQLIITRRCGCSMRSLTSLWVCLSVCLSVLFVL